MEKILLLIADDNQFKQENYHLSRFIRLDKLLFETILSPNYKELEFKPEFYTEFKTEHLGQRKLLISEIEFITLYGNLSKKILYIGAGPGIHIPYLSSLFPTHKFILWDPVFSNKKMENENIKMFNIRIENIKKFEENIAKFDRSNFIEIHTKIFTDKDAELYTNDNFLFISDIRTISNIEEIDIKNKDVEENMRLQEKWVEIIKPTMSMLKFKLPFSEINKKKIFTEYKYLDGDLYIQAWSKHSNETRLITDGKFKKCYNPYIYEKNMLFFQKIARESYYDNDIENSYEYDHCYDCTREIEVLNKYIKEKTGNDGNILKMKREIDEESNQMMIPGKLLRNIPINKEIVEHYKNSTTNNKAIHILAQSIYDNPSIIPNYLLTDYSLNKEDKNALMIAIETGNFKIASKLKNNNFNIVDLKNK